MKKSTAIAKMRQGVKITHVNFSDNEWMTMEDGKIKTEDGYSHSPSEFWFYRTVEAWNEGYSEFQEKDRTYRIMAKVTTYCYLDVVAKSQEEAMEIGENTDGGDFTTEDGGEWSVYDAQLQEI